MDRAYLFRRVNSQQTLRLIKCEDECFTDFVFMEELGVRPGLYSGIHVTQVVKENRDLSLEVSINET